MTRSISSLFHVSVGFCFVHFGLAMEFVPAALMKYEFNRNSCQTNSTFSNLAATLSDYALHRNDGVTGCALGMGVESLPAKGHSTNDDMLLSTLRTNEDLLSHFDGSYDGISIELWFKPLATDTADLRPILSLGSDQAPFDVASFSSCDRQAFDMQLSQKGNALEVSYRTSDVLFEPCQQLRLEKVPLVKDRLVHVVVVLKDSFQRVYVNGQGSKIMRAPFEDNLRHWHGEYELQFFKHLNHRVWNGRLYQFGVYDTALSTFQVQQCLHSGITGSQPFAMPYSIILNEDGEPRAASQDPAWEARAPDVVLDHEFERITLQVGSVQREVQSLLRLSNMADHEDSFADSVFVYITRLPSRGRLFHEDGTPIVVPTGVDSNTPVLVCVMKEFSVVFAPPHNEHSLSPHQVFDTLQYCVTGFEIFDAVQCESETVEIFVRPVNDPPVAVAQPSTIVVREGIMSDADLGGENVIELGWTDVDNRASVATIEITHPPSQGELHLYVSDFRQVGVLHGATLASLNYSLTGPALVYYTYSGTSQVVQGMSVADSFRFRVSNEAGIWSSEDVVDIHVISALAAIPQQMQPSTGSNQALLPGLVLRGDDTSGFERKIGYFIESVPSDSDGRLVELASNKTLKAGMMLDTVEDHPYGDGVRIEFIPSSELCAIDSSVSVGTKLRFRVVAYELDSVTSASSVAVQHIQSQCAHMLASSFEIIVPPQSISVAASTASNVEDHCGGYDFDPTETDIASCQNAAVINGVRVSVSRYSHYGESSFSMVRVSLRANKGYITLNKEYRHLIIPLDGRNVLSSEMAFLALPAHLNDILSFLHYESTKPGQDQITLVAEHGSCEGLRSSALPCQSLQRSIDIFVAAASKGDREDYMVVRFPWYIPIYLLGFSLFVLVKPAIQKHFGFCAEVDDEEGSTAVSEDSDDSFCPWVQHYDPGSGDYFYEHTQTGVVTWEVPEEGDYIPLKETTMNAE